jgi:leader peptidase (prepilin peptidase)/N-methyltransferase
MVDVTVTPSPARLALAAHLGQLTSIREPFMIVFCAVLGLIIGSFLNVVIWRLPRGESVVRPGSHCPACAHPLSAWENVPVVSWLALRGRCRHCGAPISLRYPLVEAGTAALFAGMAAHFGTSAVLPAFLYLAGITVALALIDLDTRKLPDRLVLPSYAVGLVLLGVAAVSGDHVGQLLRAVEAMAACYGAYFLICFAYPRGMGFGDVKLAGVLGLYLGFVGWSAVAVGMAAGIVLGGVLGVALLASGRVARRAKVPFGPFMVAGALLGIFLGHPVAHLYLHATGL